MKASSMQSSMLQHDCPKRQRSDTNKDLWQILRKRGKWNKSNTTAISELSGRRDNYSLHRQYKRGLRRIRKAICCSKEIFLFADPTNRKIWSHFCSRVGNIRLFSLKVDTGSGVSWALEAVVPSLCICTAGISFASNVSRLGR